MYLFHQVSVANFHLREFLLSKCNITFLQIYNSFNFFQHIPVDIILQNNTHKLTG